MGVLFLLQTVQPAFSGISTLDTYCEQHPSECGPSGLFSAPTQAVRSAISNPSPISPFARLLVPSKEFITAAGGAAALWYLTNQSMQNLQNQAIANSPSTYATNALYVNGIFNRTGTNCQILPSDRFPGLYDGVVDGSHVALGFDQSALSCQGVGIPNTPSLPDAAQNLSDSAILAEAAAAAASAARDAANRKDVTAANAASAAAAAASAAVAASPTSTQADKDKAAAAAAAAAQAAADASDPTKAPTTPQSPTFNFSQTNFLAYAASPQGFGKKFPFGMFAPLPASSTQMACPVITSWGTSAQLCFIRDIVRIIKWIVWTNFAIYCFVNL